MKSIFCRLGFTVLIIAAAASITGGVVMAASPDSNLVNKVDRILDKLNTLPKTEMVSGCMTIDWTNDDEQTVFGNPDGPVMHVSLTVSYSGDFQQGALIIIGTKTPSDPVGSIVDGIGDFADQGLIHHYEFDASWWDVHARNGLIIDSDFDVFYAATMTFIPD